MHISDVFWYNNIKIQYGSIFNINRISNEVSYFSYWGESQVQKDKQISNLNYKYGRWFMIHAASENYQSSPWFGALKSYAEANGFTDNLMF